MKSSIVATVGFGFALISALAVGQDTAKQKASTSAPVGPLKDLKDKASYVIGMGLGRQLKSAAVEVDTDLMTQGVKDALSGGKTLLTDEQAKEVMDEFQKVIQAKQMEAAKVIPEKNKKEGDAFLAANKAKPGVVTLPSGLQYKVLKDGTGKSPKLTDTVKAHYEGTLIDGTIFDSSYKRGEPSSFPVNGVIAGWTEALQKMKVGSTWQLFVPSALAYGERGRPGIAPNSLLIFKVELVGVE